MIANKLKLNDDKCELIVLASKSNQKQVVDLSLKIGDGTIHRGSSVRNLGVVFNSTFKMEAHITSVCKAASFHVRNIGSIRQYLSSKKLLHKSSMPL